jgi:hypothetical protein
MKSKTLKLQFIPCTIYINLVEDVPHFRNGVLYKKYPWLGLMTAQNVAALNTWDETHYFGMFWITLPLDVTAPVAGHEALHCVDAICETWGFEDTEFRGYMIQWILEEINKLL